MAAIAIPAIEAAAVRVLAALGVGIAAGAAAEAAREQARRRQEDADRAASGPMARADAPTEEREKCKECPPDHGTLVSVSYSMPPNSSEYQQRITGFPRGMEWRFQGRDFDGFKSDSCLLQEAKANYDQFFDSDGEFRYFFQRRIFTRMEDQAREQSKVVRNNPPAALTYYFQTPLAYQYMKRRLMTMGISAIHVD